MRKQRTADGRAESRCNPATRCKKSPGRGPVGGNKSALPQDLEHHIFAHLSDAVIVHRGGTIIFANLAAAKLHGAQTPDQLVGMESLDLVHPVARELTLSRRAQTINGVVTEPAIRKGLRIDGGEITVETRGSLLDWHGEAATLIILRDVTERKKSEEALQTREKLYSDLIEGSNFGIQVSRPDSQRLFVNRKFVEMHGYDSAEEVLVITEPGAMVALHDRKRLIAIREAHAASGDGPDNYEYDALRKDGSTIPVHVFVRNVSWKGAPAVQRTFLDVTARKKAEAEREQMVETLLQAHRRIEDQAKSLEEMAERSNRAMREAQAANTAKTEFLAMMSHELRTPLNAILGFSDIMANRVFGPLGDTRYEEYPRDINDSGQHLLDLINDILDLSKVESGYEELKEEKIDVRALLPKLTTLVKSRAERGGIALKIDCPRRMPSLFADRRKLKQILVNLLSNAIKFTPAGGKVRLKVWSRSDSGYVFQVIDNGIGIALEDIPKVMTPFHQVDNDINQSTAGTGLGLPLSKALVELHGGSLDLQSRVNGGTKVTVRFPAARVSRSARKSAKQA